MDPKTELEHTESALSIHRTEITKLAARRLELRKLLNIKPDKPEEGWYCCGQERFKAACSFCRDPAPSYWRAVNAEWLDYVKKVSDERYERTKQWVRAEFDKTKNTNPRLCDLCGKHRHENSSIVMAGGGMVRTCTHCLNRLSEENPDPLDNA